MIEEYWISDFNWDLFILYRVIQSHVGALIKELKVLADEYLPLPSTQQGDKEGERISMFYRIRDEYNESALGRSSLSKKTARRTAQVS